MAEGGFYHGQGPRRGRGRGQDRGRNLSGDSDLSAAGGRASYPHRPGQGSRRLSKHIFSTISREELENLYDCTYRQIPISMVNHTPTPSSRALCARLIESNPDGDGGALWKSLCDIYAGFFSDGTPSLPPDLPPLLRPIFQCLEVNKADGINVLSNGGGKLLVFRLMGLLPIGPRVRILTTNNPRYDWCGINGQLSGVVDIGVRINNTWLVIGEVKGGFSTPFTQIAAAMHAASAEWPLALW